MSHVYKKNRVSRDYQPIFVAEAKTLQESRCLLSCRPMMTIIQELIELLTACRKCSNILMEEKVQLES